MIVLFGSRLFGQVDKACGIGSVSTEFFHIYYFPIAPLASYVVSDSGDALAVKTRLNWKSVLVAWSRAWLVLGGATAGLFAALEYSEGNMSNGHIAVAFFAAALLLFDLLRSTRGIGKATEARAKKLREALPNSDAGWISRGDIRAA